MLKTETPRLIADHLVVGPDGEPWAVYRVAPWSYGVGSNEERLAVIDQLEAFFAQIPYRALLLGVCRKESDEERESAIRNTSGAVPSERWNRYVEEATERVNPTYVREWWVSIALRRPSQITHRAWNNIKDLMAEARSLAGGEDITLGQLREWEQVAARFIANLGGIGTRFTPATPTEIRWLYARAFRRGTQWEPGLVGMPDGIDVSRLLDVDPMRGHRRLAGSSLPEGGDTYQTVVRIDDVPREVVIPQGGEWIYKVDKLEVPVDAVVWVETTPLTKALKQTRRRHNNLKDQHNQLGNDAGPDLTEHDNDLAIERTRLSLSRQPLVRATYGVLVGAESIEALNERVSMVTGIYPEGPFRALCPGGVQRALIAAACPGMPWPAAVTSKGVAQFGLPDSAAASAAICGSDLGDPTGYVLGYRSTGLAEPVHVDPVWAVTRARPTSGSIGIIGVTGSGKGITIKTLASGVLAAGGQMVFFDRSTLRTAEPPVGEYEQFLRGVNCSRQVIALHEEGRTLNPWTCLQGQDAVEAAQVIATWLCNAEDPVSARAIAVNKACAATPKYLADPEVEVGGWDIVIRHLEHQASADGEANVAAGDAATILSIVQAASYGRAIFGDGDPIEIDADATVIWAPKLKLPKEGVQPSLEEIVGQAVMLLVVASGRRMFAGNGGRYGALVLDEAWALLSTNVGAQWAAEFAREGRKSALGLWIASQNPEDLPHDLAEHLGYIGITRVGKKKVPGALALLGVDEESDVATLVVHDEAGLITWRDSLGRVGLVEVARPLDDELWEAMDTTPGLGPRALAEV